MSESIVRIVPTVDAIDINPNISGTSSRVRIRLLPRRSRWPSPDGPEPPTGSPRSFGIVGKVGESRNEALDPKSSGFDGEKLPRMIEGDNAWSVVANSACL